MTHLASQGHWGYFKIRKAAAQIGNYQDIVLAPLLCESDENVIVEEDLKDSEDATKELMKAINTVLSAIEKV